MSQNPDWTKDELIVGLDVYIAVGRSALRPTHPRIIELSQFLNSIALHPAQTRDANFRNPAGVNLTLRKFLSYDPEYKGIGLHPEAGLKQEVWREYAHRSDELRQTAQAIREAFKQLETSTTSIEDNNCSLEGDVLLKVHKVRERNVALVKRKKETVLQHRGCLCCEVCEFDFQSFYGEIGDGFAECHHIRPLAQFTQQKKTKLNDLAIVCSNCHRMLHRANCALSVHDLKQIVEVSRRGASHE